MIPEIEAEIVFAAFDVDGDMLLNRAELRQVFGFMTGIWPTSEFLSHVLESFDGVNEKGGISKAVYVRWLKRIQRSVPTNSSTSTSDPSLFTYRLQTGSGDLASFERPLTVLTTSSNAGMKRLTPLGVLSLLQSERRQLPRRPTWFDRPVH